MSMDYAKLEILKGIDLQDSFVLQWHHENDQVIFEIEASIWPESEHYQTPKENEYTCYRAAVLTFYGISNLTGLRTLDTAQSFKDLSGSIDYGNIETFAKTDSGFELSGEFGNVIIQGGELRLEIYT